MGLIAFTPLVWVDGPDPPTPGSRPWWLCVRPDPPEPCPVRINPAEEFVDFENYDADFKFPLASSRKPMKIERPIDCIVCAPTLIDEIPPEPPECEFPSPWNIEINDDMFARITYQNTVLDSSNVGILPNEELIVTSGMTGDGWADIEYRFMFMGNEPDDFNFDTTQSSGIPMQACLNAFLRYTESGYTDYVGLVNCCEEGPTMCAAMTVQPGSPTQWNDDFMLNPPSWFEYGMPFALAFEGDYNNYITFNWMGGYYEATGTLPFADHYDVLQMQIAQLVDDDPSNFNWSCIIVSVYTPA